MSKAPAARPSEELPGAEPPVFQEIAAKAKNGGPRSKVLKARITMAAELQA